MKRFKKMGYFDGNKDMPQLFNKHKAKRLIVTTKTLVIPTFIDIEYN